MQHHRLQVQWSYSINSIGHAAWHVVCSIYYSDYVLICCRNIYCWMVMSVNPANHTTSIYTRTTTRKAITMDYISSSYLQSRHQSLLLHRWRMTWWILLVNMFWHNSTVHMFDTDYSCNWMHCLHYYMLVACIHSAPCSQHRSLMNSYIVVGLTHYTPWCRSHTLKVI